MEIFIHAISLSFRSRQGKRGIRAAWISAVLPARWRIPVCGAVGLSLSADKPQKGSTLSMQITIEVTDEIRREADFRGLPIIDFVELLIARGLHPELDAPVVKSAIERIRELRSAPAAQ